jgi:hypothetical protein
MHFRRRMKIVIYQPSARRHFSHMSALFEAQATKERVSFICANVPKRLCAWRFAQYFLKRTLVFLNYYKIVPNTVNRWRLPKCQSIIAIYFHSFEIFNIQIGEMTFCKPDFIITKSNYFQNAQKGQCSKKH